MAAETDASNVESKKDTNTVSNMTAYRETGSSTSTSDAEDDDDEDISEDDEGESLNYFDEDKSVEDRGEAMLDALNEVMAPWSLEEQMNHPLLGRDASPMLKVHFESMRDWAKVAIHIVKTSIFIQLFQEHEFKN
jgi:hypothetical protein